MKIGLVAVSAMGAHDTGLLGPALDYAAFVARNQAIASLPSLALLTLAGMSGPEHTFRYFEMSDLDEELPSDFDLVAISSYTAHIYKAYELARRFRTLGVPTVIGGPHVSCLPDEAAQHCDAVAIGEGETIWAAILEDCQSGRLKKFYGSLDATFNLQDAPMPAFELLNVSRYNRLTVETSRGCPHRCEFCASSVLISGKYKQKPAEKVLAEIDRIRELWPRPFIELADDNTFVNRAYWMDILPEIGKRNVRWFAQADIRMAKDEELLRLMRASGCREVLIGIESPNAKDLDGVELRNNWKSRQSITAQQAVPIVQSHGIMVNGCFVLGLDSHGPEIFSEIYDFVCQTNLFDVQITFLTPFPGTPLYTRLLNEGRLLNPTDWDKCTLFDINFEPKGMSREVLARGYSNLAIELYNDSFTRARRSSLRKWLRQHQIRSLTPYN